MSDNVWEVTDVPSPRSPGTPDENHQVAYTLPEMAEVWWRIYNWDCSNGATATINGTNYTAASGACVRLGSATRELDLVDPLNSPSFATPSGDGGGDFTFFGEDFVDSGRFYPFFGFSYQFGIGGQGVLISTQTPSPLASPPWVFSKSGTISVFGKSYGVSLYTSTATGQTASGDIGTITITPSAYWPYASRKDGSAIYDTSTGAQLQDPRN